MSKKKPRSVKPTPAKRPAPIVLEDRLTIVQAADLHGVLVGRLAQGRPIVIDGTRVEEIDTAVLQLLVSLWRTAAERGIACSWRGASEVLRRTAALIGLAEMLQLGHVAA